MGLGKIGPGTWFFVAMIVICLLAAGFIWGNMEVYLDLIGIILGVLILLQITIQGERYTHIRKALFGPDGQLRDDIAGTVQRLRQWMMRWRK